MKNAAGITLIAAGSLLIYAGFKRKSVWAELLGVIRA